MSTVNASIEIAASPARVWAVLMDPACLERWVTIHRGLGSVSDSPLKEGSKLDQTLCVRGAKFKVKWEVAELEDDRRAVWEGRGPARSKARTVYGLAANGDSGTRFDYENEFKAPLGPLGAMAGRALMGGVPKREANRSLKQLKALLEKK